jgi:hypothetical protein
VNGEAGVSNGGLEQGGESVSRFSFLVPRSKPTGDLCKRETRNEKRLFPVTHHPCKTPHNYGMLFLSQFWLLILKPVLASIDALPDGVRYVI